VLAERLAQDTGGPAEVILKLRGRIGGCRVMGKVLRKSVENNWKIPAKSLGGRPIHPMGGIREGMSEVEEFKGFGGM
jgi:hypothetical protein